MHGFVLFFYVVYKHSRVAVWHGIMSCSYFFMREIRRVGRALRKVTGAEKINYELHSNTGANLHMHLCPRYLDDDFPGMAIDLSCPSDPPPYESYEEYLWFIDQMTKELMFLGS